jgi:hypothetical protein
VNCRTSRWSALLFLIVVLTLALSLQAKSPAAARGVPLRILVTALLGDESGAESFFRGLQARVSFGPFLNRIETALNNQYRPEFPTITGRRARLAVDLGGH